LKAQVHSAPLATRVEGNENLQRLRLGALIALIESFAFRLDGQRGDHPPMVFDEVHELANAQPTESAPQFRV
jgi:hypothetical protein